MTRSPMHRTVATITIKDQMADFYRRAIDEGRIGDGVRIASRRDVAIQWGVAIGTVTKVFRLLSDQGYVRSHGSQGTYAIGPAHRQRAA